MNGGGTGAANRDDPNGTNATKKTRSSAKAKEKKYLENTSNVLMDLRKAASHPMLFRTHFTDAILTKVTSVLLKEPDFRKRGAVAQYVKEDMEVMTDAELQVFCGTYKVSPHSFQLEVRLSLVPVDAEVPATERLLYRLWESNDYAQAFGTVSVRGPQGVDFLSGRPAFILSKLCTHVNA